MGIILDKTNFYAESGGQENDTGRIVIDGKADFVVSDVQVFNGYVLHIGTLQEGQLAVGDAVVSSYDEVRRGLTYPCNGCTSNIDYDARRHSSGDGPCATTTQELIS